MVFDLVQTTQDFLLEHNQKPLSFYEEMMLRKNIEYKGDSDKNRQKV
jgi:hypothetical protein